MMSKLSGRRAVRYALAAMVLGGSASASAEAPDPSDQIVVVGDRPEDARPRAVEFVNRLGVAQGEQPAARWVDKVCIAVLGVEPDIAATVSSRMRAIATDAKIKLAPAGCEPNIAVAFTGDGGALVRSLAARSARRVRGMSGPDLDKLLNGSAPVRWWYSTEPRGRDGMQGNSAPPPFAGGNAEGSNIILPDNGNQSTMLQYQSAIVSTQVTRVLTNAIVVIDAAKAEGATLDAIASYAAMVAFAEIKRDPQPPEGSILGLFQHVQGYNELTMRDRAFLRGLYKLPLDRAARRHRGYLVQALLNADRDE